MLKTEKQDANSLKPSYTSSVSKMSVISAIDKVSKITKQFGENGHAEYAWSEDFKESVIQFYFQLVRTSDTTINKNLITKLSEMLNTYKSLSVEEQKENFELISTLYRMIGQTRDIISGKGEYSLSYMQILTWYKYYPKLAIFALDRFVHFSSEDTTTHPYGSWKDLKYFANYLKLNEPTVCDDSSLLNHIIDLYYKQLTTEWTRISYIYGITRSSQTSEFIEYDKRIEKSIENPPSDFSERLERVGNISLAAKWCPREKSKKFGWIFGELSKRFSENWVRTAKSDSAKRKAFIKGRTHLRKILSLLNKHLDTVQIKQCGNRWGDIDFNNVTSITLSKQLKAFQYINKTGTRRGTLADRILCADHYSAHVAAAAAGDTRHKIRGKRVELSDLVKQAIVYNQQMRGSHGTAEQKKLHEETRTTINLQWQDNKSQNSELGNMIAMVDTSGSMNIDDGKPLYTAIGLGIRISELSKLGKRIMTFSSTPNWIDLDKCSDFCDEVEKVRTCNWGMNTNFYSAMKMILDSCVSSRIPPEQVENMTLVVLSDMQMDEGAKNITDSLKQSIDGMFSDAGEELFGKGKPYKTPHLCWWNLRSTNGFPTISSDTNTTMISGFSPVILNTFIDKGVDNLREITPWNMLQEIINNSRYDELENEIRTTFGESWKESLFTDYECSRNENTE